MELVTDTAGNFKQLLVEGFGHIQGFVNVVVHNLTAFFRHNTVANALWNKGGWIQNRANTLALWCMFAQVFPLFQDRSIFTTLPVLYADGFMDAAVRPTLVNPVPQGVISILSIGINVLALALIIKRSKEQKKNPYKQEIFTDTKDFQLAMARAEE